MKIVILIITLALFLTSCKKDSFISLKNYNPHKIIALQPLGEYNEQQLTFVSNQLNKFFNTRVIILPSVDIPETFGNVNEEKYSADYLIMFLSKFETTIVIVIGLTHKDIYTVREHKSQF